MQLSCLDYSNLTWATGPSGIRLWGLFALFAVVAVGLGLWWNKERWPKLAAVFLAIIISLFTTFFTTFFTNPAGIGTGFIGSLGYWLSQQGVARGSQPWYYYSIVFPLYEYLPLVGGNLAIAKFLFVRKTIPIHQRTFLFFSHLVGCFDIHWAFIGWRKNAMAFHPSL